MLPLRKIGDYIRRNQMLIHDAHLEKVLSSEEFIRQK